MNPPYDPSPRALCPDPQLGTRDGWMWCAECGAIQPPGHKHDSLSEMLDRCKTDAARIALLREALDICEAELDFERSLLGAMAFDHGADPDVRHNLETGHDCVGQGWATVEVYGRHPCIFCEAAGVPLPTKRCLCWRAVPGFKQHGQHSPNCEGYLAP